SIFVFIASPLFPGRGPGGDDAYDLDPCAVTEFFSDGVGHREKEHALDQTQSLPTQLPTLDAVLYRHIQRVAEYLARFLKAYAVLALVGQVLGLVPLESHTLHAI